MTGSGLPKRSTKLVRFYKYQYQKYHHIFFELLVNKC
nr:MAG TPA: hypothetical protein [Caudoviricetes sp.]